MIRQKVLLVDLGISYGGTSTYIMNICSLLQDRIKVYALCVNRDVVELLRNSGMQVFSLVWTHHAGKMIQVLGSIAFLLYLKIRYRIDVIWVQGIPEVVLIPIARGLGCRAIITRHLTLGAKMESWIKAQNRRIAEAAYMRYACFANKTICVSQSVGDDLLRILPSEKIVVIPNCVKSFPKNMSKVTVDTAAVNLLFVGRLLKYKGAAVILDAMRQIKKRGCGFALTLTVVGEGEYRKELELLADGLDVYFAGLQKDVSRYYRDADIFIHPTYGPEGSSLVTMEAMACGLPCILSDLTVNRELSDDGRCALLFRVGDADDLCLKLESFISSPELRMTYRRRGYAMVQSRYSAETVRASYLKVLGLELQVQS
jgi:glycosyltransferase involved in cell wall biosynthesis